MASSPNFKITDPKFAGTSIECVIFDMDGTIIDTEEQGARAIESVFKEWGIQVTREDMELVAGRKWDVALEIIGEKYNPPQRGVELESTVLNRYRGYLEQELPLVPGSVAAIKDLAGSYPLALVSGSKRQDCEWVLSRLEIRNCFKYVLGAEDYPKSKPAPDGFNMAMELLGAAPTRTLIFEDSEPGILSARSSGAFVFSVERSNHFGHDLSQAHGSIFDFEGVTAQWLKGATPETPANSPRPTV